MTAPDEPSLLPCPFCGSTPNADDHATFQSNQGDKWGFVVCCCQGPEVRTSYRAITHWRAKAIEAWNRRSLARAQELPALAPDRVLNGQHSVVLYELERSLLQRARDMIVADAAATKAPLPKEVRKIVAQLRLETVRPEEDGDDWDMRIDAANLLESISRALAEAQATLGPAPSDEFTRERLLYLLRLDWDCLPECDSYGHAEGCAFVEGPAQLNQAIKERDEAQAKCSALEAVLRELVECKDLKDALEVEWGRGFRNIEQKQWTDEEWSAKQSDYDRRKPLAWKSARAALASQPPEGGEK